MKKRSLTAMILLLILALSLAVPVQAAGAPGTDFLRVLGTNGTRTVGLRTFYGDYVQANGAVIQDNRYEFVYTDDGVNWISAGAVDGPLSLGCGWYDGAQFWACPFMSDMPTWRSADGIHWVSLTAEEQAAAPAASRGRAVANGLTFTLRGGRELWVTDGQDRSAELTGDFSHFLSGYDMADIQTWPVPEGIRVAVYSRYGYEVSAAHTYSGAELDARLAAAGPGSLQPDFLRVTGNGDILLGQAQLGTDGTENLRSSDGLSWQAVEGMPSGTLLPYNGKTFVVVSGEPAGIYASEDGLTWKSLEGTVFWPEREAVLADYTFLWTGTEYITCRTVEEPYGPHGVRGDWTSDWNTRVCFADEDFQLTSSYDFGANVTDVGFSGGEYYVKAGGTVWASPDGESWQALSLTDIPAAAETGTYRLDVTADQVYGFRWGSRVGAPLFTASQADLTPQLWEGRSVYAIELTDEGGNVRDIRVFTAEQMEALLPQELSVLVDGKPVAFPIPLYQERGCTMAPLRQLAGALGYTFSYDSFTGTAVCTRDGRTISVQAGSTLATVDGVTTDWLAVPAVLKGGYFCVPVRFFAEAAGAEVSWDGFSETFRLSTAASGG